MTNKSEEISPSLEFALQNAENVNKFDYNKMMLDFELESRHQSHLRKIRQKWVTEGKKHQKKIDVMKDLREDEYKKKNAELMEKLNSKNQLLLTALVAKREAKSAEKQKIIKELIEKENEAKKNVEIFLLKQEEQRLIEAQRTQDKMDLFQSQNQQRRQEAHDSFTKDRKGKLLRYSLSYAKVLERNKENEKYREEQIFKKYEAFYWHQRDMAKLHKERKIRSQKKMKAKEERLDELQMEGDKRRKDIMKRLQNIAIKKEEYEKKRLVELEVERSKRKSYNERTIENKIGLQNERDMIREEILENQNILIKRAFDKENVTDLKRFNAHETTVVKQLTLERNLSTFNQRLNKIKDESIFKKPYEERLKMFKEMKQKELERKRKEEEDKQIKS